MAKLFEGLSMGTYTDAVKLRKLYKAVDTSNLVDIDIEFFIKQAEAIITAKIAARYLLPFATIPALIETLASEFSLIKILDRFFTSETNSKNDWRTIRMKDLNAILDGIVDGSIPLTDASDNTIAVRTDVGLVDSNNKDFIPIFNNLNERIQQVDPDLLEEQFNELDLGGPSTFDRF